MAEKREVLKPFRDGQDHNRPYGATGVYPRDGFEPTQERYKKLADLGFIEEGEETFDENNTNDELREELDRRGIEYKQSDNKDALLSKLDDADGK